MTIQKEMREVIDTYTDDGCLYPDKNCEFYRGGYCVSNGESYKCLMKRLGELGVVIRVECEHSWKRDPIVLDTNPPIYTRECQICREVQQTGLDEKWHTRRLGSRVTEPLIEEASND